jgi:hypothetical protein
MSSATLEEVTLDEVRTRVVRDGLAQNYSLELSREQYLLLQQFVVDALGTRRYRLDQDLELARCVYLGRLEPRFPVWHCSTGKEGIRSATGKSRQWIVIPHGSLVRAVLGGRGRRRIHIYGYVRPGRGSSAELSLPIVGGDDLVFSTFGGAACALAERLGYRGRRSGSLTFEMEWRPGQWVRLEALRPIRLPRRRAGS